MEKWITALFLGIGSVIDINKKELPTIYLGTFILIGLAVRLTELALGDGSKSVVEWITGGVAGVVLAGAAKFTRESIGYGDALAVSALGIWLGFFPLIEILFIGLLISAVYSAWLLFIKRMGGKYRIAFLPFLEAGYLMWLILMGEVGS